MFVNRNTLIINIIANIFFYDKRFLFLKGNVTTSQNCLVVWQRSIINSCVIYTYLFNFPFLCHFSIRVG